MPVDAQSAHGRESAAAILATCRSHCAQPSAAAGFGGTHREAALDGGAHGDGDRRCGPESRGRRPVAQRAETRAVGGHSRVRGGSARGRMMMPRWRIRIIPYFNEHRSGARSEVDDRFRDPVPTPVRKRTLTDEIGAKVIDMAAARARHPRRLEPRVGIDCSIRGFSARGNRKTRGLMPRILEAMSTLARLWR